MAATREYNNHFKSTCIALEVEFNEAIRHLPSPRPADMIQNIHLELDDVGTRSTRYHVYEKSFERLVDSCEMDQNGIGPLLRKVKIEYDRHISILTTSSFRRKNQTFNNNPPLEMRATIVVKKKKKEEEEEEKKEKEEEKVTEKGEEKRRKGGGGGGGGEDVEARNFSLL